MDWDVIRDCGCYFVQNGGTRKATKDLLMNTITEFAKISAKFYDALKEFPFVYSEKQIGSVLIPALYNSSDAVFQEQPAIRKQRGKDPNHGWIDYWVLNNKTTFLIELKQSSFSYKSHNIKNDASNKWVAAIDQLKQISKNEVRELSITNNAVKMALLIMGIWQHEGDQKKLQVIPKEEVKDILSTVREELSPAPSWSAVWYLHERLQKEPQEYSDGWYSYPGVMFHAYIEDVSL